MAENMMNSDHKATNKNYRENYDRIFSAIVPGDLGLCGDKVLRKVCKKCPDVQVCYNVVRSRNFRGKNAK